MPDAVDQATHEIANFERSRDGVMGLVAGAVLAVVGSAVVGYFMLRLIRVEQRRPPK